MADYIVTLTDDEDVAFHARVAFINQLAALDPPAFPPVTPVADVTELIASYFVPPKESVMKWYLSLPVS